MAANNTLSHYNQRGQDSAGRGLAAGLSCAKGGLAENIWKGLTYRSMTTINLSDDSIASEAVVAWVNSPAQWESIFALEYTESGVGVAITDEGEVYATQNFC